MKSNKYNDGKKYQTTMTENKVLNYNDGEIKYQSIMTGNKVPNIMTVNEAQKL